MEALTPVALREESAVFIGQEHTSPEKRLVHRRSALRKTLVLDNPQHLSSESDDDIPTMYPRASTSRPVFPTSTNDSELIGNANTHLTDTAPATPDRKPRRSARISLPAQTNSVPSPLIAPIIESPPSEPTFRPLLNTAGLSTPKPEKAVIPRRSMRLSTAIPPPSLDLSSSQTPLKSPETESHASQDEREVHDLIIFETPSPESAMPMNLHPAAMGVKTPTRSGVPDLLGCLGSTPALFLVTATPEGTTPRSTTRRRSSVKPALIDLRDQDGTDSMDVDVPISNPVFGEPQSVFGAPETAELLAIGDQPDKDDAVPPTPSPRGSVTPEPPNVEPLSHLAPSSGRRSSSPLPFTCPSSPKPSAPPSPAASPRPRRSLSPEKENYPTQVQELTSSSSLDEHPAPTPAHLISSVPILSRTLRSTPNRRASLAIGTPATPDPAIGGRLRSLSPDTTNILHNILPRLQGGPSSTRTPGPSILSTSKPRAEGDVSPEKSVRFKEGEQSAKEGMDVDVFVTGSRKKHVHEEDEEESTLPRGLSPPKIFGAISRLMFRPPPPKDDRPLAPPNNSTANPSSLPFPIISGTKMSISSSPSLSISPARTSTSGPVPAAKSVDSPKLATSSVPISQIPVFSPAKRSGLKLPTATGLSQLRQPSSLKAGPTGPGIGSKIPRMGTKPYARPTAASRLPKPASKNLSVTIQPQASTSNGALISAVLAPPSPAKPRRNRAMGLATAVQQPLRQVSPPFSPGTVVDASQIIDLHSRFKATQQKAQQLPSVGSVLSPLPIRDTPIDQEKEKAPQIVDPYIRLRDVTKKKLEAMASPPPMGIEDPVEAVTEESEEGPEPVTRILDPSKKFRARRQAQVPSQDDLPASSPPLDEDEGPTVDPLEHSSPDPLDGAIAPLSTLPWPKPRDMLRRGQLATNKPFRPAPGRTDAPFPATAPMGTVLSGPSLALLKKSRKPPTNRSPASSVPGGLPADAAALRQLTNKNTERNQAYAFSVVEMQVILKEGKRPPSPTTRVKTILEKRKQAEDVGKARGERAARRAERREGGSLDGTSEASGSAAASEDGYFEGDNEGTPAKKHSRGPGEEEDYETPIRRTKRAREEDSGSESEDAASGRGKKRVKWDKELQQRFEFVEDGNLDNVRKGAQAARTKPASKGILVATVELDRMGNIPETKLPPLPNLPKEKVPVSKFVYIEELPPTQRPKRTAAVAGRKAIAIASGSE